jgi:hypothetical protein
LRYPEDRPIARLPDPMLDVIEHLDARIAVLEERLEDAERRADRSPVLAERQDS